MSSNKQPESKKIRTRVTRIPAHVINASWQPLSSNAISEIMNVVEESATKVVDDLKGANKQKEFQELAKSVLGRVSRKLQVAPVPKTRESAFSYEANQHLKTNLESMLLPLMEQVSQLETQILKEETLLQNERDYLNETLDTHRKTEQITFSSSRDVDGIITAATRQPYELNDNHESIGYEKSIRNFDIEDFADDDSTYQALISISKFVDQLILSTGEIPHALEQLERIEESLGGFTDEESLGGITDGEEDLLDVDSTLNEPHLSDLSIEESARPESPFIDSSPVLSGQVGTDPPADSII